MSRTGWLWLILGLLYAGFFSWYTSFGGPLSDAEIEDYLARFAALEPGSENAQSTAMRRFMEEDTGDDFVMLNIIDLYETPLPVPGVEPGASSSELLDRYMAFMFPELLSRASHPVMLGSAANTAMDLMNAPGMETWESVALMRYRSRRDLLDIATNPDFRGSHGFKIAAMEKTIAFPLDPWFQLGDPRLVLALLLATLGFALSWRFSSR